MWNPIWICDPDLRPEFPNRICEPDLRTGFANRISDGPWPVCFKITRVGRRTSVREMSIHRYWGWREERQVCVAQFQCGSACFAKKVRLHPPATHSILYLHRIRRQFANWKSTCCDHWICDLDSHLDLTLRLNTYMYMLKWNWTHTCTCAHPGLVHG